MVVPRHAHGGGGGRGKLHHDRRHQRERSNGSGGGKRLHLPDERLPLRRACFAPQSLQERRRRGGGAPQHHLRARRQLRRLKQAANQRPLGVGRERRPLAQRGVPQRARRLELGHVRAGSVLHQHVAADLIRGRAGAKLIQPGGGGRAAGGVLLHTVGERSAVGSLRSGIITRVRTHSEGGARRFESGCTAMQLRHGADRVTNSALGSGSAATAPASRCQQQILQNSV